MFMGPIDAAKPWDPNGIDGSKKFLDRVWRLFVETDKVQEKENPSLDKVYNYTVKKVTNDYENMFFNTAISQIMIFVNAATKEDIVPKKYAEGFVKLLSPVAPHIAEELWNRFGHDNTITYEAWPTYDESKLVDESIEIPVQVNGKVRATVQINVGAGEEEVKNVVHESKNVQVQLEGKTVVKEIYVKNKIYNIVVK